MCFIISVLLSMNRCPSGTYQLKYKSKYLLKSDHIEIISDINRIHSMTINRAIQCFFQVIPIGIMGLVLAVNRSRPSSALVRIKIPQYS